MQSKNVGKYLFIYFPLLLSIKNSYRVSYISGITPPFKVTTLLN